MRRQKLLLVLLGLAVIALAAPLVLWLSYI